MLSNSVFLVSLLILTLTPFSLCLIADDTGESMIIRDCALDSGSLTIDTEIVRSKANKDILVNYLKQNRINKIRVLLC